MKLIFAVLMCFLSFELHAVESHDIVVEIKINCPMSDEFIEFVKSIPTAEEDPSSFEEWKSSFIHNMTQLIRLVESEQVYNSSWYVQTDYRLPEDDKGN